MTSMAQQFAGFMAQYMPSGWSVDTTQEANYPTAAFNGPDGARVVIRVDGDRIKAMAILPEATGAARIHSSIQVNRFRGADVVAKEIQRRLLPDYLAFLPQHNEVMQRRERLAREADAIRPGLLAIPLERNVIARIDVQENAHVALTLHGLTGEQAATVLRSIGRKA